jgi:signal transduction histidine kinase
VRSLRRRLLVWSLAIVLLGGVIAGGVVFYQARKQANELFDYQLRQLAFTLRDRDYIPSQQALTSEGLDFVIQVWAPDSRLLYRTHPQIDIPGPSETGFADVATPLGTWRVFTIQHRGFWIQVAQHRLAREALAFSASWPTLLPVPAGAPSDGILMWGLVGREVRFLRSTAQAVARRTPESLEPIEDASVPEEVQPLVDSLNGLMARLGGALAQQRQFIADAAHELRTPLTALRLQLQLAERAKDAAERDKAHEMLRQGIARASRMVEQLLTLAREDPQAQPTRHAPTDLAALAREVAGANEVAASAKGLALIAQADVPSWFTEITSPCGRWSRTSWTTRFATRLRIDSREGASRRNRAVLEVEDTGPASRSRSARASSTASIAARPRPNGERAGARDRAPRGGAAWRQRGRSRWREGLVEGAVVLPR